MIDSVNIQLGTEDKCEISFSTDGIQKTVNLPVQSQESFNKSHLNKGTSVYLPNQKAANFTTQMHHARTNAAMAYRGVSES